MSIVLGIMFTLTGYALHYIVATGIIYFSELKQQKKDMYTLFDNLPDSVLNLKKNSQRKSEMLKDF